MARAGIMKLQKLLECLWEDYAQINPRAEEIVNLLRQRNETILNDHIAFRSFGDPRVGMDVIAKPFLDLGYSEAELYRFKEKKLNAKYLLPLDLKYPKVFISELCLKEFSKNLQDTVARLINQLPKEFFNTPDFLFKGAPWRIPNWSTYEALVQESEYAGWMAVFGFRANHFTVNVNALKSFADLGDFNQFVKNNGFVLNHAGGEIKGSPEVFLEQSSTLAEKTLISFPDGARTIPGCYYEFALRYPMLDGQLFQGFVTQSADKIFESTHRRKS